LLEKQIYASTVKLMDQDYAKNSMRSMVELGGNKSGNHTFIYIYPKQKQKSQSREPLETAESAVNQKHICFLTGRLETAPPPSNFVPDIIQTKHKAWRGCDRMSSEGFLKEVQAIGEKFLLKLQKLPKAEPVEIVSFCVVLLFIELVPYRSRYLAAQLLCWCSRSLPAAAAATAAVAVMDALIPDTGRAKCAPLPIHEVTQPALEDMPGHHDSVLWE
ncbi:hypothetical protein DV515_00009958, partial [Chloebia gouldiae]